MTQIHVLDTSTANKIAAGEVIERPASIVKELVENSLDAGAREVEVTIRHGGRSLIRVSDDGYGMDAEDAELAFQRHATSKIARAEDLGNVTSFGFRGEALPSIAAVARIQMKTRLQGKDRGVEVHIEGGKKVSVKETSCRTGTILEVRDLFFNTPARRKFLKTDSTEKGHVMDVVAQLAVANPQVRFVLNSQDKTVYDLVPVQSHLERVSSIWAGVSLKDLIEIEGQGTDMRVCGVIAKPRLYRSNRSGQNFFINHRWIRSISLAYAFQEGYHGLLMHGQYPLGAIFIEVNPERVDVNVHPTKQEVRISQEREIKSLLRRTIAEALQKEGELTPSLKMPQTEISGPAPFQSALYFKKPQGQPEREIPVGVAESGDESVSYAGEATVANQATSISIRDQLKITKILGQIHHTFIVAETDEGMIVIDQHAAHERVMFEVMLREIQSGHPKKQRFLMDEILEVHDREYEILKKTLPLLESLGYEIEEFGDNSFVVRAYPAAIEKQDPLAALRCFIEEREEGKSHTQLENHQEDIAALIACKRKSVKAHDVLTLAATEVLLKRLALCDNPFNCPHGRPTFFKHTFGDLERQFKRKV